MGHYYDQRVAMATGFLVDSGLNPYQPYFFNGIFSNPLFEGTIPNIGYPAPWPILLGLIYRFSYSLVPNLFVYNFAIKIPILLANICLAFVLRTVILRLGYGNTSAQYAWLFMLFNPFILLITAAWGGIDVIVALFCVASLYLATVKRRIVSGVILGVAVALKPIALCLAGMPLLLKGSLRKNLVIFSIILVTFFLLYFGLFFVEGWSHPLAANDWNSYPQFLMAGGMTPFNVVEIIYDTQVLPSGWEFLGYLWLPALIIGYLLIYFRSHRSNTKEALFDGAIVLTLIFFLTRSWLSEPNFIILIALMLVVTEQKTFMNFHFVWILPLVFLFLNYSIPQLFFLVSPSVINSLVFLDTQIRLTRLLFRLFIVILWQFLAWNLVYQLLLKSSQKRDNSKDNGVIEIGQ